MRDTYKVDILEKHIKAQDEDEYYLTQVTGSAGKPINLDKNALLLLKEYYSGKSFSIKTPEEIIASRDENDYVEGYVQMHIGDLIDNDYEGFLDLLSILLIGSDLLMDITYDVVALADDKNTLIFKVHGDASSVIED